MGWTVGTDVVLQPVHRLKPQKNGKTFNSAYGTAASTQERDVGGRGLPSWFCEGFSFWTTFLCRLLSYSHIQAI